MREKGEREGGERQIRKRWKFKATHKVNTSIVGVVCLPQLHCCPTHYVSSHIVGGEARNVNPAHSITASVGD